MEKIFTIIKQMEADGVIGRYAIGGADGSISAECNTRPTCAHPFLRALRCMRRSRFFSDATVMSRAGRSV